MDLKPTRNTGLLKKRRPQKQQTLPFHGKLQYVRNADLMLECEECGLWRLIYAKHKLSSNQHKVVQDLLEEMSFSCSSSLQDLDLPSDLVDEVFIRDLNCSDTIELLYYSAKYDPICIYCAKDEPYSSDKYYPQCSDYKEKPPNRKEITHSVYLLPYMHVHGTQFCIKT